MPYHLKSDERVAVGLKRIVSEELEAAASGLDAKDEADWHEAIHEARKSVKKIRAILRLIRPELGRMYRDENAGMREVGRKLSEIRDAGATVETFDSLGEKYHEQLEQHNLGSIRCTLVAQKEEAEGGARAEGVLAQLAETLRTKAARLEDWPLKADGFVAIAEGLERTYRRGRKALETVDKHPRSENYHEWRKRVKDHWYHVRLIHAPTDEMKAYEKSLKELETGLGDDHNLVMLREKISSDPQVYGAQRDVDLFLELMGNQQRELRRNATLLGERVYDDKPGRFTKRMRRMWNARQPGQGEISSPTA
jgi:CHAD domain-containing protein